MYAATLLIAALITGCSEKPGGSDRTLDTAYDNTDSGGTGSTDSGGTDSGGTDSGGTDSGGSDGGGTDSGGTDSGGTDSGGSDGGGSERCELAETSWDFSGGDDLGAALYFTGLEELSFQQLLVEYVLEQPPAETCPSISQVMDTLFIDAGEGGCTTLSGISYQGRLMLTVDDETGSAELRYEGFSISSSDAGGSVAYAADGRYLVDQTVLDELTLTVELAETRSVSGSWAVVDVPDGRFERRYTWTYLETDDGGVGSVLGEGSVQVLESELGPIGDYCFTGALDIDPTCEEPTGTVSFIGAREASLRFDGAAVCDRCGEATIDGEDAGSWCF